MRYVSWISAALFFLVTLCSAQDLSQETWKAFVLPDYQGSIMQYSFPIGVGNWSFNKQRKAYKFDGSNSIQIQTVNGVSELYLSDNHDFCSLQPYGNCTFLGTFVPGLMESKLVQPDGSVMWQIYGNVLGAFIGPDGVAVTNVYGYFSVYTYPANNNIYVPTAGAFIVWPYGIN